MPGNEKENYFEPMKSTPGIGVYCKLKDRVKTTYIKEWAKGGYEGKG